MTLPATLLPNARQQFLDTNGDPLAGGSVGFYVPSTLTPKTVWGDPAMGSALTNPVTLDAGGWPQSPAIYGAGNYRQIVKAADGTQIWDGLTADPSVAVFNAAVAQVEGDLAAFATYAALRAYATTPLPNGVVQVEGRTSAGDGGQGSFVYVAGDTTTADNGGTVLVDALSRRWYRENVGASVSLLWWGADASGSADCHAAFVAANAVSLSVSVPAGVFLLNAQVGLLAGTKVTGAGMAATTVNIAAGLTAFTFILGAIGEGRIEISEMSIQGAGAACGGFDSTLAMGIILWNLRFVGLQYNVIIDRCKWVTIRDCQSVGNASRIGGQLVISSTSDSDYVFFVLVENYQVNTGMFDTGVVKGTVTPAIYFRRVVQWSIIAPQLDHGEIGTPGVFILVENDSQGGQILGGASHGATIGVLLQPGAGVAVAPGYIDIIGHDVDKPSTAGIRSAGTGAAACSMIGVSGGCLTAATGANVPYIDVIDTLACTITGVRIQDYTLAKNGIGVNVTGDVTLIVTGCVLDYVNVGFDFQTSNIANTVISNNTVTNFNTGITGTISGSTNRVVGNLGINPFAVTTPGVPASGTPVVNDTGTDVVVYVLTGTITNGIVNGQVLGGATNGPFTLAANAAIEFSYSGSVTWKWIGS